MFKRVGFRKSSYLLVVSLCVLLMAALPSCAGLAGAQSGSEPDSRDAGGDVSDFSFYKPPQEIEPYPLVPGDKVRNVVLLIGDGMGLGQVALARMAAAGINGKLHMERLPVAGLMRTHAARQLVTDSAASATAMACGIKTDNGVVSMDRDNTKYLTILEAAKEKGMSTGLVATSTITHATPACFGAHAKNRNNEVDIAEGLLDNRINVLLGGGRIFFLPASQNGKREDGRNLIEEAKQAGYYYAESGEQLDDASGPYLLGLLKDGPLTTSHPEPTLAELAAKAIELLSRNEGGFFLMVEGSQIDWACHANDRDNVIKQTLCLDEAVKVATDFALRDRQTLVIVTGDHETGGLIVSGNEENGSGIQCLWPTRGHSAMPVPVYAFGPGAMRFTGVYDNTALPKNMADLLGVEPFPMAIE